MADSNRDGDPPRPPKDDRPPLPREVVHAFLSSRDTIDWVNDHVKETVPAQVREQVAQDALLESWKTRSVPSDEAALRSWLRTITDRVVADFLDQRKTRSAYEGPMPSAAVRTDEAGLPIDDPYADDIDDIDPSDDPREPPLQVQGLIIRRFLAEVTANAAADRQTFEIMCEHCDEDKSYEQIAREREIPIGTLNARVHRFGKKYRARCERHRRRVLPLLWGGGALLVAVFVAIVWALLHRAPKVEPIRPDPPSPPPSASAYDPRLDIAAPPPTAAPVPPAPAPEPRPSPRAPLRLKP